MSYTRRVQRNRFDVFTDEELVTLGAALSDARGHHVVLLKAELSEVLTERYEEDRLEIEELMGAHD